MVTFFNSVPAAFSFMANFIPNKNTPKLFSLGRVYPLSYGVYRAYIRLSLFLINFVAAVISAAGSSPHSLSIVKNPS